MGFFEKNIPRQINIQECPAVHKTIEVLFKPLRDLLENLLNFREEAHIFITLCETGVDLLLAGFKRPFSDQEKATLKQFAADNTLARLTLQIKRQQEVLYKNGDKDPYVLFGGYEVPVSSNAFLQASAKADQVLAELMLEHLDKKYKKIADLFCGRGTLSLPLYSAGYHVDGFECDKKSLKALDSLGLENLNTFYRDLFNAPLSLDELKPYDAVVLDPPRAGCEAQVNILKDADTIERIVYVSCGASSFARDAKMLCDGNFTLDKVIPVDQFMWSHHIETVGIFTKR